MKDKKIYLVLALVLICVIGFLDYLTGWELQFFIFYLLPIGVAAWFGGALFGVLFSFLSILTWGWLDIFTGHGYSSVLVFCWNAGIRLAVFSLFAFFIYKVRNYQESHKDYINFIVHDLRTPLATISSGLSNLEDMTSLDDSQKDIVNICKVAAQRGLTLVSSILDLARIEARRMQLSVERADMEKIINSAFEVVSIYAKNRGVVLKKKAEEYSDDFYTDTSILLRILVNLLSNAIKASAANGNVYLVVKSIGSSISFNVSDEGKGFPEKTLKKAYGKFSQFHSRDSGGIAGSGLGLAFCKAAVFELGGKIDIHSQEGKGTSVIFTIPNKKS